MSTKFRKNRKATDADIITLNSVGLSLATVAKLLNIHPTTVTIRLKSLGIEPADTRRSFMEDVFFELTDDEKAFVADQVVGSSIRAFVTKAIKGEYLDHHPAPTPAPAPEVIDE